MHQISARRIRSIFLCTGLIVLASQVSITLLDNGFHLSVAVILFQLLPFLLPELPVLPVALLSAPGVFLLRLGMNLLSGGIPAGSLRSYAPEMLFYLVYGQLLALILRRRPRRFTVPIFLLLTAADACSNFAELLLRVGPQGLTARLLLQIAVAAVVRTLIAWLTFRAADAYGLRLLRREDSERLRRLLLMTATLRSEVVWMEKGTALVEDTMSRAYLLHRDLRKAGSPEAAEAALAISRDIHELKKEYLLVIRGISEALTLDPPSSGMALPELFRLMARSTQQFAAAAGADVTLECRCDTDLRTGRHYELMSVFRNLLNNAVEAAPSGRTAHLQLCAKVEHDVLCCSVEDDCGGIPPERLSQIFLPGFSSKINHETGEFNRGLGLAIVQDLVETQLGGSLSVRSADGHTTFAFTIPCKNLEESHDADLSD